MPSSNRNVSQYQHYFTSGYYDRRYPRANYNVLALIKNLLPDNGRVLDYGCGSGRYLLELRSLASECIGFDICEAALSRLRNNLAVIEGTERVTLLGPHEAELETYFQKNKPVNLALCLFGVLAHIDSPQKRQHVLRKLAQSLDVTEGRLIISVPNQWRRFRKEQRNFRGKDQIVYTRRINGNTLKLSYRLYNASSLSRELEQAGFEVEQLRAESLFPESWLGRSTLLARVDHVLCRWLPANLGYGILAVARLKRCKV